MFRTLIAVAGFFAMVAAVAAQGCPGMIPGPKSPEESLRCIQVRPGLKVELMAAEPLVHDPIAFAWGPDGKLWVCEMGDYPLGVDGKNKPGGRIKILTRSTADGPYDKAVTFLEGIGYPTGVTPYRKGVLVTCAPDIFFAEDTDGDGKADRKEVLFTGFVEGNQQHRVNGLEFGLDGWFHGANGDSGGMVKSIKTGRVVDIRGRDFRLKPDTGEFEATTGQSQFGRHRDDAGHWFGNNNSNPMFHYALEDHLLRRNPHVVYPPAKLNVSVKPGAAPIFPASKALPRFNDFHTLNHFTSACSTIIYRDDYLGDAFRGNAFISEPVHNLVHREVMKRTGTTFSSQRADDEQTSEFLASSDNWFRPTSVRTGPDGALWIADMYRYVIEHPQWIPLDWQRKLDLRAGHDMGRIYRVVPKGRKLRAVPRLDQMTSAEIVKLLESPNGWQRDSAHRWLIENNLVASNAVQLRRYLRLPSPPLARLHALCLLDQANLVESNEWASLVRDASPDVRRWTWRLLGQRQRLPISSDLIAEGLRDAAPMVRMEAASAWGEWSSTKPQPRPTVFAEYLVRNASDPYLLAAGMTSIHKDNWAGVWSELRKLDKLPAPLAVNVPKLMTVLGDSSLRTDYWAWSLPAGKGLSPTDEQRRLADLLDSLSSGSINKTLAGAGNADSIRDRMKAIHASALATIKDSKRPIAEILVALRVLNRAVASDAADREKLAELLQPQNADEIQSAAMQALGRSGDTTTARMMIAGWRSYSPKRRAQLLDILLSRATTTLVLIDALTKKDIPASELDASQRQRLLQHTNPLVRSAGEKLFAAASSSNREAVLKSFAPVLGMFDDSAKTDASRGEKLFTKICSTCHKLGDTGANVGPDLLAVGDKSPQGLLTAILDPNRAVESRYLSYIANLKNGQSFQGILAAETSAGVTLLGVDGKSKDLLRTDIDELLSTGKSLMPEGLEKDLAPHDLADVIRYVRDRTPKAPIKAFAGNRPALVEPLKNGQLVLNAAAAEVRGPKIVFEQQYGNLGYWMHPDDSATWTLQVPRDGVYNVEIVWAVPDELAGEKLALRAGGAELIWRVPTTGSWDRYLRAHAGTIRLSAGRVELTARSARFIRQAMLDLKEIRLVPRD